MSNEHGPAILTPTPVIELLDPEQGPIDSQLVAWLEEEYSTLRHLLARTTQDLVTIGHRLTSVKEGLAHQEFLAFIAALGLSRPTAYRWMSAAQAALGCSHVENIEPTALYALSAKSTSDEVREAFLARADAGHRVTLQEVQTTLRQGRTATHRPTPNLVERLVDDMIAAEEARAGRDWRGRAVRAEYIAREIARYGEEHRADVATAVAAWGHACVEAATAYLEDGGAE
jgi:predicted DNA-binding transcriptional regulator AlpA